MSIVDFGFEPAVLDLPTGATVVWTNTGQVPHTVTGSFADSGALSPGQTFRHTFAEAGAFDYVCSFHPQMTGRVQVEADVTPAASPADPATSDTNAAGTAPAGSGPVGTWLMTLTPEEGFALPPQQALVHLHADGTLDAAYAATGEAPTSPGWTVRDGQGTWGETNGDYSLSVVALLVDEHERYAGVLTMQETGEIDAAGETVRGQVTFSVISPDGGDAATGSGTTQGTRIRVDRSSA